MRERESERAIPRENTLTFFVYLVEVGTVTKKPVTYDHKGVGRLRFVVVCAAHGTRLPIGCEARCEHENMCSTQHFLTFYNEVSQSWIL